jgi:hypothetical protein
MADKRIIDDRQLMRPTYSMICTFCAHFQPDSKTGRYACATFGDNVPDDIWYGRHDHKTPYDGDKGIQFEPLAQRKDA